MLHAPVFVAGLVMAAAGLAQAQSWQLVWSDEFNGSIGPNWVFETGAGGWGNNEWEYYTNSPLNACLNGEGSLVITARAATPAQQQTLPCWYGQCRYTSARLLTRNRFEMTYGKAEACLKIPYGQGIWPAFWMLGANMHDIGWPACGEIDIMELLGQQVNKVYGTIHWGSSTNTYRKKEGNFVLASGGFDEEFHVYSLIWTADDIKILVDDQQYFQALKAEITDPNPFNSEFFFLFNIAVGGNWPGAPDNTTVFPQRMFVDYIRVFQ